MSYKDDLIEDLDLTFFNEDEMAERVRIGDRVVLGIYTSESIGSTSTAQDKELRPTGIVMGTQRLCIRRKDFPNGLQGVDTVFIRNQQFHIQSIQPEKGGQWVLYLTKPTAKTRSF